MRRLMVLSIFSCLTQLSIHGEQTWVNIIKNAVIQNFCQLLAFDEGYSLQFSVINDIP